MMLTTNRKRILGVDYGDARTGLALSDLSGFLASGIGTVKATGMRKTAETVAEAAKKNNVSEIVLGLPVNMNGTEGPRAEKARAFGKMLEELTGLSVILFDERLTTSAAHQIMNMTNTRGKDRKGKVDTLSAEIILQDYLDSRKRTIL